MSRLIPKATEVQIEPKQAKRFVRILKATRIYLNGHPDCEEDDVADHICIAMDAAVEVFKKIGKYYPGDADQLQSIIDERLGDQDTFDEWFKEKNKMFSDIMDEHSFLEEVIQAGRAQWLESLIKEFKKIAKSED